MDKIKKVQFTSKDIEVSLGFKVNTLHYYIREGCITPDIDEGSGTGHRRLFSAINFFEATIIKYLMSYGIPKKSIVGMMKSIQNAGDRHRLDPQRFFDKAKTSSEETSIEYLIFFRGSEKPEKFGHRFVIDGKKKYLKTRGQMREAWKKTTQDEVESLNDFLINSPGCLLLNLTSMFGLFLLNLLCEEYVT